MSLPAPRTSRFCAVSTRNVAPTSSTFPVGACQSGVASTGTS
jgi:hypothetical protein